MCLKILINEPVTSFAMKPGIAPLRTLNDAMDFDQAVESERRFLYPFSEEQD